MLLHLSFRDVGNGSLRAVWILYRIGRILIEVGKKDSLTEGRFVMDPRASIPVPTCSNLEVEGTVDSETR